MTCSTLISGLRAFGGTSALGARVFCAYIPEADNNKARRHILPEKEGLIILKKLKIYTQKKE
jgi:hypothetical protein